MTALMEHSAEIVLPLEESDHGLAIAELRHAARGLGCRPGFTLTGWLKEDVVLTRKPVAQVEQRLDLAGLEDHPGVFPPILDCVLVDQAINTLRQEQVHHHFCPSLGASLIRSELAGLVLHQLLVDVTYLPLGGFDGILYIKLLIPERVHLDLLSLRGVLFLQVHDILEIRLRCDNPPVFSLPDPEMNQVVHQLDLQVLLFVYELTPHLVQL